MTREEISQAYHLSREIDMWKRALERIEEESKAKATPTYVLGGKSEGLVSSPVENMALRSNEMHEIIEGLLAQVQIARKKIIVYIDTLDDSLLRQIVFHRCVSCLSWKQVATNIGGGNTPESVRMRFNRAFPSEKNKKN